MVFKLSLGRVSGGGRQGGHKRVDQLFSKVTGKKGKRWNILLRLTEQLTYSKAYFFLPFSSVLK